LPPAETDGGEALYERSSFERGNHLGRGRPKGSRNKQSAKQFLDQYGVAFLRKAGALAPKEWCRFYAAF